MPRDLRGARGDAGAAGDAADAFGLDPEFREQVAPIFRWLHDHYWRVTLTGLRHLPRSGPALLIANHSGALPFDGAMICTAIDTAAGVVVRYLYDRFVANVPLVDSFYRKTGGAVATRENARALLAAGHHVLIFPEGVPGVAKPFDQRYQLRPFSPGFARLAAETGAPVIPIAVLGAEEIYPIVGRAESLGRSLGMPYVPITPFFPLLGVLGALPLPTKWFIRIGRPITVGTIDDEARARAEASLARRKIQAMVTRLRRRRRSVFFG
ncbi:MAG TPA: lysophospholipid acyltransferase family protein [Candidatus Limnocylindria bacterium]|nr:lysophospholipid acyltransferase family protein [Candidatus Limnocylindria bacterium]